MTPSIDSLATDSIVIVGGGTAGWITACVLAADHPDLEVTLIESPDVPTIGVGEGTWPSMRMTMQRIGLPESRLFAECDASPKQGTEFIGWASGEETDRYYHPFSLPTEYTTLNLADYWLQRECRQSFADYVTPQAAVIAAGLAPKQPATPDYAFNVNYGYHFDAGKFAAVLHEHAVDKLGVRYVSANVSGVVSAEDGYLEAVELDSGETLGGQLFVDCTGQRALLLGQHFGVPLKSVKDVLFNDTAIAAQIPYGEPSAKINSVTHSTAKKAGWIWDIGLQSRRGIGYVFSSAHTSEEAARAELAEYISSVEPTSTIDSDKFRLIRFEPGYRETFWVNNCVAVGLSAGFVEPLEASALAMIEQSASGISKQLPKSREIMAVVARRFNEKMTYHWEKIIEFLKLHYVVSRRDDSSYWQAARDLDSCPDDLRDKLVVWQQQPPWHDDAPRVDELFPSASYQYVLYGMGFRPRHAIADGQSLDAIQPQVEQVLRHNQQKADELVRHLTPNRELLGTFTRQ